MFSNLLTLSLEVQHMVVDRVSRGFPFARRLNGRIHAYSLFAKHRTIGKSWKRSPEQSVCSHFVVILLS